MKGIFAVPPYVLGHAFAVWPYAPGIILYIIGMIILAYGSYAFGHIGREKEGIIIAAISSVIQVVGLWWIGSTYIYG